MELAQFVLSQQMSLPSTSSHEGDNLSDSIYIKSESDMEGNVAGNVNKTRKGVFNQQILLPSPLKCEVKEEMMYCQFCSYIDVDFGRLKCHTFIQHPTGAAVVRFGESDQDFKFFCVKETCNFSTTVCTVYEEHLMNCCPLNQTLSGKDKERLKSTLQFVLDFHNKHCLDDISGFLEYFSSFNKTNTSEDDHVQLRKHKEHNDLFSIASKPSTISHIQSSTVCENVGGRKLKGPFLTVPNPVPVFIVQNRNPNLTESLTYNSENTSVSVRKENKNNEQLQETGTISKMKICSFQDQTHMETQRGKKPFACVKCDKRFQYRCRFLAHMRLHLDDKLFKCDVCDKTFRQSQQLISHKRIHTGEKPFTCHECNKRFNFKSSFRRHMKLHSGEKPFICDACGKEFTRSSSLITHKRIHTGEKPYKCNVCRKEFNTSSSLISHKRIHTGEKPYKCSVCDKGFSASSSLTQHKKLHTSEKPLECNMSDRQFIESSSLIPHKKGLLVEEPLRCNVCDKGFVDLCSFNKHKRRHIEERPFRCQECNKRFSHSSNLVQHMKLHSCETEKPFKCDECGKEFTRSKHLIDHKRIHSGEKPFKCSVCGKEFRKSSHVISHKRTHTGERPYRCNVCGKSFAISSTLIIHKRTHTGERPYKCSVCDKGFVSSSDLSRHKSTHSMENHLIVICETVSLIQNNKL